MSLKMRPSKIQILKKLDAIENLPSLPSIVFEVNRMLKDSDVSVEEISQTIKKDQSMVPRILKLVNSAFFGLKSKISSLDRAIIILGYNTVRNALVAVSVIDAFNNKKALQGFDIKDFWIHSISVAVTGKYLAARIGSSDPEDVFTGGLLHDIGRIVLYQFFPDLFKQVWNALKEQNISFFEAEQKEINITHARIGAHLAKKWQLPDNLVDIISHHHKVEKSQFDKDMVMIIHMADLFVHGFMTDPNPDFDASLSTADAQWVIENKISPVSEWLPEIKDDIQEACQIFIQ